MKILITIWVLYGIYGSDFPVILIWLFSSDWVMEQKKGDMDLTCQRGYNGDI